MKTFKGDSKTFRAHLLNHMTKSLFDLFVTIKFVIIIQEKWDVKYGADGTRKKKYVIGEWIHF